ncbi:NosD domain-containing protein [Methanococcus maripaludis]|uniref:Nitrous oxidase accessory protein NosD n=1 Tax=Methanococcus maripaludis TaxID=39152 RepID=A0A2L1CCV2_METMI|nr:right-handed parallel beta-helix repeat-containing protein [Methanococcus maripaludis]AVB77153.1 Periplasmic copper-binding protein NosD [Methanococcus maripaludis]MBA2863664.1 nitrous oxidase accessory protein NosD [Methanococcus maripaludis]MBB6496330.1 nitrous oxidase accessory protein NosD [Methanococcus maripaludis]
MGGWTAHAFIVIDKPGEYTVTTGFANNSLDSNSIVFLINNTENVTLDCNEMSFTTNTTNSSILVYAYNSSNIVVKNMNANWSKDTIIFENVNDSTIENSEIITEGYSIKLEDSYGATISGNDITVANGEYYGIYVDGNLENGTIFGNTINVTNNNNVCGIYTVSNITNSVISGNTITVNTDRNAYAICADEYIVDSTIENNVIDLVAGDDGYTEALGISAYDEDILNTTISGNNITAEAYWWACGIDAYYVMYSEIENNVINVTARGNDEVYADGIYADYNITNNVISGNNITAYSNDWACGIDAYSGDIVDSTIEDNVIDVYVYDYYNYGEAFGIYAYYNINNTEILRNTLTANASYEAYGICTSDNDIVDSTIEDNVIDLIANGEYFYENLYAYTYAICADDYINNSVISRNIITAESCYETDGIEAYDESIIDSTIEDNVIDLIATGDSNYIYAIYADEYTINSSISGNTITANASDEAFGVYLYYYVTNTTISDNQVTIISESDSEDEAYGIYLYYGAETSIISSNSVITYGNYSHGIEFDDYGDIINVTISDNTITTYGEDAYGISIEYDMYDSIITGNTVNTFGNDSYGIYTYYDIYDSKISDNTITTYGDYAYGIELYDDDYYNVTLAQNTVTTYGEDAYGISIEYDMYDSIITGNTVNTFGNDSYGIYTYYSVTNTTISSNTVTTEGSWAYGIYIYDDPLIDSTISDNAVTTAGYEAYGIYIEYGAENSNISGNTVITNGEDTYALYLYDVTTSSIFENTFTSGDYAIYINSSEENRFYLNNIDGLLNNGTDNYFVSSETITYSYNGKSYTSILGNYWVGYDESDTNGDGIIDTPYTLNGTNDTKPLADMWNDGEIGNYVAPSRSSGGSGRSYDSDISDEIESKVIKNFVSSATVLFGNGIDEQYAVQLRERVTDANGYTISGNAVIVGGPNANGFAKEYNDQFEMPISNDYPGENRGIIQVMDIQDNSGTIIRSYTIVYIAGSDRLGTQAALEYFKTLDELPEGPIMIEWTANGPVVVE